MNQLLLKAKPTSFPKHSAKTSAKNKLKEMPNLKFIENRLIPDVNDDNNVFR